MSTLTETYLFIKKELCNLVYLKEWGNTIEIGTGISTINQSYISVFVSQQNGKYVVSDGGWIDSEEYFESSEDEKLDEQVEDFLIKYYSIKRVDSQNRIEYFYKITDDIHLLSARVHDVASFVGAYINAYVLQSVGTNKPSQSKRFSQRMRKFMSGKYGPNELAVNRRLVIDSVHRLRFSFIISPYESTKQVLVMNITGSRTDVFNDSIARAASQFQSVNKYSPNPENFQKVALLNTDATGYKPADNELFLQNLIDEMHSEPVLVNENSDLSSLNELLPNSLWSQ